MQTYSVDDRTIEIFDRTPGSVFPNIESWQTEEGDLLLAASQEPIRYDVDTLRERLASDPFKEAILAAWEATSLEDFLAHYIGNLKVAKTLQNIEEWPLNSDDRTVIEFAFARSVGAANGFQIATLRNSAHAAHCDRPAINESQVDWGRVEEARHPYLNQRQEPKTLPQLELVGEALANEGNQAATKYIDEIAGVVPSDAEAIKATLHWKEGKANEAAEDLQRFFQIAHENPWPDEELIRQSIALAETVASSSHSPAIANSLYESLRTPLCVWNSEIDREVRLLSIAAAADGNRLGDRTARSIAALEPHIPWNRQFLELRAAAYKSVHDPRADQAARDLDEFMQHEALTSDPAALTR